MVTRRQFSRKMLVVWVMFYNGYKVMVVDERAGLPVREHIKKDYMSDNYHKRIQKKWTKRFGLIRRMLPEDQVIINGDKILMSLKSYKALLETCIGQLPTGGGCSYDT